MHGRLEVLFKQCNACFKLWTFPRASTFQLLGQFWPVGHGLHTPGSRGPLTKNLESPGVYELDSHRRVDEVVIVGNCRLDRLLFADKLVLHAWIFSAGSSARIWSVFCCVLSSRNENQHWNDRGILSLKTPKAVHSAIERKYTAAGGDVHVPWGGIHEWRKSEQRDS